MGFIVSLQVDIGDVLNAIRPDNLFVGDEVVSFYELYSGYNELFEEESKAYQWFQELERKSKVDLRLFWNKVDSKNWNYDKDDYEKFMNDYKNPDVSYEKFIKSVNNIKNSWIPIDELITVVEEFIRILPEMDDGNHWCPNISNTILGFQGILDTLMLAKKRFGDEVRITIS
jgi:hypothetical protein